MSFKKRQEALERFGRPVVEETSQIASDDARPRRQRLARKVALDSTLYDDDSDFIDDGEYLEDDVEKPSVKRNKGKGRAKASANESENPRVMLLSLKAGAFGLNLTVANNVYL